MNSFDELKLLTPWLKSNLEGGVFKKSTTPGKDLWQADIEIGDVVSTLVMASASGRLALFLERQGRTDRGAGMTRRFFERLEGCRIRDVRMAPDDRLIAMAFDGGWVLVFVIFGPGANVLLIDPSGGIVERFRKSARDPDPVMLERFLNQGEDAVGHETERASSEDRLSTGERASAGEHAGRLTGRREIRNALLEVDPRLPREHLDRVIETHLPDGGDIGQVRELALALGDAIRRRPDYRVLGNGRSCLIPEELLPDPSAAGCLNINDMIRTAFHQLGSEDRFETRKREAGERLSGLLRRRRHRLEQLGNEELTSTRAESYEKTGHVLLAHAHLAVPEDGVLRVQDPYADGATLELTLDPKLSLTEHAKRFYAKAEKSRTSITVNRARRRETEREIRELELALLALGKVQSAKELKVWQASHAAGIREPGPAMPYRELSVSGYAIWIGKSARDNDDMLKRCHKEDLWLHARGVAGSHVVIRMGQKRDDPPAHLIETAASFAAWHSKSRGSSLVPVIVSRRKYVVKSKGSAPGAVRVLKENVVHVPPAEPPGSADWDAGL